MPAQIKAWFIGSPGKHKGIFVYAATVIIHNGHRHYPAICAENRSVKYGVVISIHPDKGGVIGVIKHGVGMTITVFSHYQSIKGVIVIGVTRSRTVFKPAQDDIGSVHIYDGGINVSCSITKKDIIAAFAVYRFIVHPKGRGPLGLGKVGRPEVELICHVIGTIVINQGRIVVVGAYCTYQFHIGGSGHDGVGIGYGKISAPAHGKVYLRIAAVRSPLKDHGQTAVSIRHGHHCIKRITSIIRIPIFKICYGATLTVSGDQHRGHADLGPYRIVATIGVVILKANGYPGSTLISRNQLKVGYDVVGYIGSYQAEDRAHRGVLTTGKNLYRSVGEINEKDPDQNTVAPVFFTVIICISSAGSVLISKHGINIATVLHQGGPQASSLRDILASIFKGPETI